MSMLSDYAVMTPDKAADSGSEGDRHAVLLLRGLVIPLEIGRAMTLGRDDSVDIMLVDARVSKKHAKIYYQSERYYIEDLKSSNGTFVNRKRIAGRTSLVSGDEVLIYPYTMTFRMQGQAKPKKPVPSDIVTRTGKPRHHFSGHLNIMPLPDLIQLLNSSRRAGTLTITVGEGARYELVFVEGEIVHAHGAGKSGEEAVFEALTHHDGDFEFTQSKMERPDMTIKKTTVNLLIEGYRRMDEFTIEESEIPRGTSETVAVRKMPSNES